ncbi:MAG TPA: leishmanolysin-related zinc metalloendopeptidase [Gemmatimonadaceae bacterium]
MPLLGLLGCRDEPTSSTLYTVEASLSGQPDDVVGTIVTPAPGFVVRNAQGEALANLPVSITITRGNGSLRNAPLRTGTGITSIGEWTLDTVAGINEIRIAAGAAAPVIVRVVGNAGPPVGIVPEGQLDAFAGDVLSSHFSLRVLDRYGNPVRGVVIDLAVGQGGGEVSPNALVTDNNGIASGLSWRLGRLGGPQQLIATSGNLRAEILAAIRSNFNPIVRAVGSPPSPQLSEALANAIERIHGAVVGDAGDVPVLNFDLSRCGLQGVLNETVDDVVIFAQVGPIDGVGKVLASAGPCVSRTQSRFPVIGIMRFDSDDLASLAENGRLPAVVLHEMLHVIGIGTLWHERDMLVGSGTSDPRFSGTLAASHCIASGGLASCADGRVPVENTGGPGTQEGHWRESTFDTEVMTGFVESNADMPFSAMSIASLADLGYTINLLAGDPFQVPVPGSVSPRLSPQLLAPWEVISLPLFEISSAGVLRPIRR